MRENVGKPPPMLVAFPEGVCWKLDLVPPPGLVSVSWAQRRKRRGLSLPYMGPVTGIYFLTNLRPLKECTFQCSRMKLKWSPHRAQHESLYLVTQAWQGDRRMGWGSCGHLGTGWTPNLFHLVGSDELGIDVEIRTVQVLPMVSCSVFMEDLELLSRPWRSHSMCVLTKDTSRTSRDLERASRAVGHGGNYTVKICVGWYASVGLTQEDGGFRWDKKKTERQSYCCREQDLNSTSQSPRR